MEIIGHDKTDGMSIVKMSKHEIYLYRTVFGSIQNMFRKINLKKVTPITVPKKTRKPRSRMEVKAEPGKRVTVNLPEDDSNPFYNEKERGAK